MPRLLLILSLLFSQASISSAHGQTSVVSSMTELRKLGVLVERVRHDTPMASIEIGSLIQPGKISGEYIQTECVVLSAAVDNDRLALADAGLIDSVTAVRRNESTKERSIFLVPGRDLPRSYLAFQFNVREANTTKVVRYLFPLAAVAQR